MIHDDLGARSAPRTNPTTRSKSPRPKLLFSITAFLALTITALLIIAQNRTEPPPAPSGLTQSEHSALVNHALIRINDARTTAGLNKLTLDDNTAAQSHAENMTAKCTRGHWGPRRHETLHALHACRRGTILRGKRLRHRLLPR